MPSVEHRRSRYLNKRAENSHQPARRWERVMRRFKSPGRAQWFLTAFGVIGSHFRPRQHLLSAGECRRVMADQFAVWREATGSAVAA